jgi:hypothetical protein
MKACLCKKCQMRWALQESGIYPLCYICFLKTKKLYSFAIKTIKQIEWWNYKTGIGGLKIGWSFARGLKTALLFANILNHPFLNKTCKVPLLTKGQRNDGWPAQLSSSDSLKILGESEWRIHTALTYFGEIK